MTPTRFPLLAMLASSLDVRGFYLTHLPRAGDNDAQNIGVDGD
jgi:hypothetical protein